MPVPGFTAEASLCKMSVCYKMIGDFDAFERGHGIITQQMGPEDLVDCYTECNKFDKYDKIMYCSGRCLSNYLSQGPSEGGIHFGGRKPCRPRCGSCRPMPSEGPGLWKFCITRDCDGDFYPC